MNNLEFSEITHDDTQHEANLVQENENQNSPATPPTGIARPPTTVWEENGGGCDWDARRSMYRAVLSNDWPAAEKLLKKYPSLAYDIITERRDLPLHLSIAMKNKKFAERLVKLMDRSQLELLDGSGYTACCYAAISAEMVDIASLLISKNDRVVQARNQQNVVPLQMAMFSGKYPMIVFLFGKTPTNCLLKEEWLELLHTAIATKMYDLALLILKRDGSLATMRNDEELTALHLLARQDLSEVSTSKTEILLESILGTKLYGRRIYGEMEAGSRHLANDMLASIGKLMRERDAIELLQSPPILHDAAKVGNVELIVKITRAYPDLLWLADSNNRSIFHIAVMHRQEHVFSLIRQIGGLKNIVVMRVDQDRNNILHLAAKLGPLKSRRNMVSISALQMQTELEWFKEVEAFVPRTFIEMENSVGKKPRDLFSSEHAELLRESEAWMRRTADSCMLIATIILTVVYAAAFTVPGGNNGETGYPIMLRRNWFSCFFAFEALALFGSTLCIITFWSITSSGFREERFRDILPYQLRLGLSALFGSLIGAISAFMSAYFLVLVDKNAWELKSVILVIYGMLVLAICGRFSELLFKMRLPKYLSEMMSSQKTQTLFSDR